MAGAVADSLVGGGTVANRLVAGSRASCLGGTLLAFFPLGIDGLADPTLLTIKPLFTGDSETNSNSSASLPLVKLLTLAELAALAGELLFVNSSAKLALALPTLKVGVIPAEGLAEFVTLVAAEPIFVNSPAPLALLDCLVKSPSIEFSSLKLSRAVAPGESTSFFPGIQLLAPLIPPNSSIALTLSISASLFYSRISLSAISKILKMSFMDRIGIS